MTTWTRPCAESPGSPGSPGPVERAALQPAHAHRFLGADHRRNERRVWAVIVLTALTMVAEIVAGTVYGSMALVADGWHMATHAGAMLITALAYGYARRHADDPRFTFGTGKVGELAAFSSAVVLGLVAVLIAWESAWRLASPVPIHFEQAIAVAVLGLVVNLVSAWLLRHEPPAPHGHDHDHGHGHAHAHAHAHAHEGAPGHDHNLRAAYVHVLADALTSVLAIVALLLGRSQGWLWADPLMGLVGALVIARWSIGLLREAGSVLLDASPESDDLRDEIREALAPAGAVIHDLHVWQVGPGRHAAIVSASPADPARATGDAAAAEVAAWRARLGDVHELAHVTIELQAPAAAGALRPPPDPPGARQSSPRSANDTTLPQPTTR